MAQLPPAHSTVPGGLLEMPAGQRLSEELKFDQGKASQVGRKHIRKLDASGCRWVVSETIRGIDRISLLDGAYSAAIDGKCQSIWLPVDLLECKD
jgi:hypothetical protein